MKPGDLCKLVGTIGWGDICLILEINANGHGITRVLRQNGTIGDISPRFLGVVDES